MSINIQDKLEDLTKEFHQDTLWIEEVEQADKTDSESKVEVSEMSAMSRTNLTRISTKSHNNKLLSNQLNNYQFQNKSNLKNQKSSP